MHLCTGGYRDSGTGNKSAYGAFFLCGFRALVSQHSQQSGAASEGICSLGERFDHKRMCDPESVTRVSPNQATNKTVIEQQFFLFPNLQINL